MHPVPRRSTPPRTLRVAGTPALLVGQILRVFFLLAPCGPGASPPSMLTTLLGRDTSNPLPTAPTRAAALLRTHAVDLATRAPRAYRRRAGEDRKSTRLNSSHLGISY